MQIHSKCVISIIIIIIITRQRFKYRYFATSLISIHVI